MSIKLNKIKSNLKRKINSSIECYEQGNSLILEGKVSNYNQFVLAGKVSANRGYKFISNNIEIENFNYEKIKVPIVKDKKLHGKKVDVLIIGGGIIGSSIGRELSKYHIKTLMVDKESDLAIHSSSRNYGVIYSGLEFNNKSTRFKFVNKGKNLYKDICKELDLTIEKINANILLNDSKYFLNNNILKFKDNDLYNKVNLKDFMKKERIIKANIKNILEIKDINICCPYKITYGYAENGVLNGLELSLNTYVSKMVKDKNKIIKIITNRGEVFPKIVINAAGAFSDQVANMAGDKYFSINTRKSQFVILDKNKEKFLNSIITNYNKKLNKSNIIYNFLNKNIYGNIVAGSSFYECEFKEDYSTDKNIIDEILNNNLLSINGLSKYDVINFSSGIEASTYEEDFIIEKSNFVENLIHVAGIQIGGIGAAPAIAKEVEELALKILKKDTEVKIKENFNPYRKSPIELKNMTLEEKQKIIEKNPSYGTIICTCEEISKGEIVDALSSPIKINTLDGIKRRIRAGNGRCAGNCCMPLIMDIISKEMNLDMKEITKCGNDSKILLTKSKIKD